MSRLRCWVADGGGGARGAGITPQQHQLLLALKGQPGKEWASVAELATALQIKHHAAVGLVDRCAEAGLVARVPSVEDRRLVQVHLTAKGDSILAHLSEANRSELAALRRALSLDFLEERRGE